MDVLDAFQHLVKNYPGGAEALAVRMGISANVLRNKADRKKDSNKVSLQDADLPTAITGDYVVVNAFCQSHGGVFLKIDADAPASDLAVLELVTQVWRCNGDVGQAVHEVLSDHKVEKREIPRVRDAVYREIQSLQQVLKRLEEMAE